MNKDLLNQICVSYHLGVPIKAPQIVMGGLLHDIWKVQTNYGVYAIKCIKKESALLLVNNLLTPQASQEIAAQMQARGVSTVVALQIGKQYYLEMPEGIYIVMPWTKGTARNIFQTSVDMSYKIGKILARIQTKSNCPTLPLPTWRGLVREQWCELINNVSSFRRLANTLKNSLKDLIIWSNLAAQVNLVHDILSHRDLDYRNVLWSNSQNPIVLDWEYAGLINPHLDVFIAALNWSGLQFGFFDREKFAAVINGYKDQGPTFELSHQLFYGYYGYCLDWLVYNLQKVCVCAEPIKPYIIEIYRTLRALRLAEEIPSCSSAQLV